MPKDGVVKPTDAPGLGIELVHEALDKLEREDPRKAEVVTLRYFAGLSVAECASAIGVSLRTVDNEWRFARIWLHRELSKGDTSQAQLE